MSRRRTCAAAVISAAAVIASLILGICIGSVNIPLRDVIEVLGDALFGIPPAHDVPKASASIILTVRVPRVFLAFLAGAALSVSGAAVQSVLGNPLASPFTLGTSSGASLGASLVIAFDIMIFGTFTLALAGLLSAVASMFLMVAFARKLDRSLQSSTVVLTGMVLSLFINAVVTLIANVGASGEKYKQLMKWQSGSFAGRGRDYDIILAAVFAVCFTVFMLRTKELDILTFGDEQAQSIGLNTGREKALMLILSAVLAGTAVAFAGVIGFVDLIAPHIARKLIGAPHKRLLPMSAAVGGTFMVLCDLAARTAVPPNELPVGVVTSLIGAPFFAFVYFRRRKERC